MSVIRKITNQEQSILNNISRIKVYKETYRKTMNQNKSTKKNMYGFLKENNIWSFSTKENKEKRKEKYNFPFISSYTHLPLDCSTKNRVYIFTPFKKNYKISSKKRIPKHHNNNGKLHFFLSYIHSKKTFSFAIWALAVVLGYTKHIICGHKNLHLNRKIDGSDALYFIILFMIISRKSKNVR